MSHNKRLNIKFKGFQMGCNIVKVTCKNTVTNYSLTTEHLLMEKVFVIF